MKRPHLTSMSGNADLQRLLVKAIAEALHKASIEFDAAILLVKQKGGTQIEAAATGDPKVIAGMLVGALEQMGATVERVMTQ